MKPLNLDEPGCSPVSSNCVIWQGRDIECIQLCKGDTVSDVVYKLATELCAIMDTLNITSYDLSCFNLTSCAPKDFQALLQFLIGRICFIEDCSNCTPDCNGNASSSSSTQVRAATLFNGTAAAGCPDCEVVVAPCFTFTSPNGDKISTMQLLDYVTAIGNKVCTIVSEAVIIQQTLVSLDQRVTVLENTPPVVTPLPQVTPVCVINPGVATDMNIVLTALEQQFCALQGTTGTPAALYGAILNQCNNLTNLPKLYGYGNMGSIVGWASTVNTLADSLTNMWLTICDMRAAIATIQVNCCPTGCNGVAIDFTADIVSSTLTLYLTGSITPGFVQCPPTGLTLFTISDESGNTTSVSVDIATYLNNVSGYPIALAGTPINTLDNLTITANPCFYDSSTQSRCESCIEYTVINTEGCPSVTYTGYLDTIDYTSVIATGTASYTVELYDSTGTTLLSSQTQTITGPDTLAGTFSGLSSNTTYKLRVVFTSGSGTITCPFSVVTTLPITL